MYHGIAVCHLQQLLVCFHIIIVVSGEITTLVVLDYEIVPNYHLRIRATDMGSPTLFSKLTMAVSYQQFIQLCFNAQVKLM